jgi:hypothetical protein
VSVIAAAIFEIETTIFAGSRGILFKTISSVTVETSIGAHMVMILMVWYQAFDTEVIVRPHRVDLDYGAEMGCITSAKSTVIDVDGCPGVPRLICSYKSVLYCA